MGRRHFIQGTVATAICATETSAAHAYNLRVGRSGISPQVKILFDIYHQQISEGNLIDNIRRALGRPVGTHQGSPPIPV